MKKLYSLSAFLLIVSAASAQVTVTSSIVPQYTQGASTTNNNRVPIFFWAEISGLTPGATYRYYTALDSLGSSATSNGAGNPILINPVSGTFRRTTNASLSNPANYDSLVAGAAGTYSGWFAVEPTGNGRYLPGKKLHPQINMNNGNGGTSVATRLKLSSTLIRVINFGTSAGDTLQGSALFDSASVSMVGPKSIMLLYDNNTASGRPLSSGVVEMEGINQNVITSVAAFYRDSVDQFANRWGAIIPNANPNGVRTVEYRDLLTDTVIFSLNDNDGLWCPNTNTVNPSNGGTPLYLGENFELSGTILVPDTAYTLSNMSASATTNGSSVQYSWDFGDGSPADTSATPAHMYMAPGTYTVTVVIQSPGCGITLTDTVTVLLGTGVHTLPAYAPVTAMPNPSGDGRFELRFASAAVRDISVFNTIGELLLHMQPADQKTMIDLHGMPAGVYFVRVREANGSVATQKLIVR